MISEPPSRLFRKDVAEWSGLTYSQLEYLIKENVLVSDMGDQRKRFSLNEARLGVVAKHLIEMGLTPRFLADHISWLRTKLPPALEETATSKGARLYWHIFDSRKKNGDLKHEYHLANSVNTDAASSAVSCIVIDIAALFG